MRRLYLPLLAVLALLVPACGGGGDGLTYASFLDGVDAARDAGSARISLDTTTQLPDGDVVSAVGDGVVAFDGSAAELTVQTEVMGQSLDITTIVVDQTFYVGGGFLGQMLGDPDAFLEVTAEDLENAGTGMDLSGLVESADQAQSSFDQLRGILEDSFEVVGSDEIDGESVTHLRGTVATEDVLAELGDGGAAAYLENFPETYTVDVFVDDQNRPRRVSTDVSLTIEGQDLDTSSTVDFTDYGIEVDVEAPENTRSFREFMEGLGGLGG